LTLDLPAPIAFTDVETWSDEVDAVVVGFGRHAAETLV